MKTYVQARRPGKTSAMTCLGPAENNCVQYLLDKIVEEIRSPTNTG